MRLPRRYTPRSDILVLRRVLKIKFSFFGHCETAPMLELSAVVAITFTVAHILKEV